MPDALTLYRAASWALVPIARPILLRRLTRGKEHPTRWREKLGEPSAPRPDGLLFWLHAVGLGEAMALRALFPHLDGLSLLVTTGTRVAAEALAPYLPANACHQFLPLDTPPSVDRFLNHWRPDLTVWCEQEVWPGFVYACRKRQIPQAIINARMGAVAFRKRRRFARLARAVLSEFQYVSAQDPTTAHHLTRLGAYQVLPQGSLKPASPPLPNRPDMSDQLPAGRHWIAVSTHREDEAICLAAQRLMGPEAPHLILAPRYVERVPDITQLLAALGLEDKVSLVPTTGQLGGYLHLAESAYIGGTQSDIEGHNPWEAARLGLSIAHGPRVGNFEQDYADLASVATLVRDGEELAHFLTHADHPALGAGARDVAVAKSGLVAELSQTLIRLAKP